MSAPSTTAPRPLRRRALGATLVTSLATSLAAATLVGGGLAPASAATAEWQDGLHDEDTIISCITGSPATGVSANVSWMAPDGQVPEVGEKFYLRGYVGLVGLPCSGKVAVLPEILVPSGIEFVDEDVRWDLTEAGEQQDLGTEPLAFDHGQNGGILVGNADFTPFTLRQGDILELQFPVRATRVLKGPATQQPECQSRREGTAPCPVSQAGDHLQIAFTVGGHGGDKQYVTPYVGLFAGGGQDQPGEQVDSTTRADFTVSTKRKGTARVTVDSDRPASGGVVITDKGRPIARGSVQDGVATVRLPRLRAGKHVLVATYAGSTQVAGSASAPRKVTLR